MRFSYLRSTLQKKLRLIGWLCTGVPCAHSSPALDTLGALDSLTPLSVTTTQDPSVAYFNPALLLMTGDQTHIGIIGISQRLSFKQLPRPEGSEIGEEIYRATLVNPATEGALLPLPTSALAPKSRDGSATEQVFAQIGLTRSLIDHRLSLGFIALIPLHRFELQGSNFVDERAQYGNQSLKFERWGDSLEGLSSALGVGFMPYSWVSLGAGISLNTRSVAESHVFLSDASYQGETVVAPQVTVHSVVNPHFSLAITPPSFGAKSQWRTLGSFTLHTAEDVRSEGKSVVKIWGYPYPDGQDSITQNFTQINRALPLRLKWGFELVYLDADKSEASSPDRWVAHFGGGWTQWSKHTDRAGEESRWVDQWEANIGAERWMSSFGLGIDFRWRPTPVPIQAGRSSYVDPTQLAASVSGRVKIWKMLSVQLNVQAHRLVPRTDIKQSNARIPVVDEFPDSVDEVTGNPLSSSEGLQSNNPGFPGFQSEGWVWVGGLSLRIN